MANSWEGRSKRGRMYALPGESIQNVGMISDYMLKSPQAPAASILDAIRLNS